MRIGGMASGMDTEQMVRDLMRAERMRLDKFFQQEQRVQWRQEAFTGINRSMARFILDTRQSFGITSVSDSGYFRPSAVNGFDWVKTARSSNESAVRATATASTMPGNHEVEVKQLARVASATSKTLTGTDGILNADGTFSQEGSFTVETANGKMEMVVGEGVSYTGESITPDEGNEKILTIEDKLTFSINGVLIELEGEYSLDNESDDNNLAKAIQSQLVEKGSFVEDDIKVEIDENNKLKLTSKHAIHITASAQGELGTIGLEETNIRANSSINDIVRELNSATNEKGESLGIRAAYDAGLGQLMITSRSTGKEETIKITGDNNLLDQMFGGEVDEEGRNAKITFNGEDNEIEQPTNNFSIFGINLQLQATTAPGETITINVDSDVDGIFDKVKEFVDGYNALLDEVNGQLGQRVYRDFPPLTDEQKEAMSEKDIEKWEEKARSGLLRNDPTLTRTLQSTRTSLYQTVEGVSGDFNHLTQLGITTGNYQSGGKLVIDEEKLRSAIGQDPEGVMDLLFKIPDGNLEGEAREKQTGLVQRVYSNLMKGMEETVRQAGPGEDSDLLVTVKSSILRDFRTRQSSRSVLDRDLLNLTTRIAREEDIMNRREDRYWRQFTAMEKALSEMYQQSDWLMAQMGQGF